MNWKYTGAEPATFPDWTDKATGQTLMVEPGQTYDIAPAEGRDITAQRPEGLWERPAKTSSPATGPAADKE